MAVRVLIAYDGSTAAEAAVMTAGRLFSDVHGRLLTVIEPAPGPARAQGFAFPLDPAIIQRELDALAQEFLDEGREVAARGLETAGAAGLRLESGSGAWRVLAEVATARGAAVIVAGSRGHGGLAATVLGSVSSGLVHNAETPALIVRPSE